MCGITGYWKPSDDASIEIATSMAEQIRSRGPDDAGAWTERGAGLALAHRRLSVLDLSPAGAQPMHSPCGRYVLIYNGEIYNHQDLRNDLLHEGGAFEWRGHSDTETLLAALRHWGISGTLDRVNGMFAFALWDRAERTLFLARDRVGEKPLYYGRSGDTFMFGSELKSLASHPDWQGNIDRESLALYLRHSCVPAPRSIYRGIAKLPPAHFLTIREGGCVIGKPVCYWSLADVAEQGAKYAVEIHEAPIDDLEVLLRDAVSRRMTADVPLGALLSGGIDSTTIVALMQAQSSRPVRTFSIGFEEAGYNEAEHAKAIAQHLGTEHTEMYVTPAQAMDTIPKLPMLYDEPFSDVAQIPTYLVSLLARRHVTVSLSGDGGDELFCGYNRHIVGPEVWHRCARLPVSFRRLLGNGVSWMARRNLERYISALPRRLRIPGLGNKLEKLGQALVAEDGLAFYRSLASHWKEPTLLLAGVEEPGTILTSRDRLPRLPGLREQMMYLDMATYLHDDILTKVDRASMAVSLEVRVPMLDHRIIEFAWRVPTAFKYRDGESKWLLRQVLYRYVPRELMDRPKMGFGLPIEYWLRGPLREWAEDLLGERRLREEGNFNPDPIRKIWNEHIAGKRLWHHHLWDVLMFQAWKKEWC